MANEDQVDPRYIKVATCLSKEKIEQIALIWGEDDDSEQRTFLDWLIFKLEESRKEQHA